MTPFDFYTLLCLVGGCCGMIGFLLGIIPYIAVKIRESLDA